MLSFHRLKFKALLNSLYSVLGQAVVIQLYKKTFYFMFKPMSRSTLSGAAQDSQCMTSEYRESDKRANGSCAFEWLSRYFDVTLIILRSAA